MALAIQRISPGLLKDAYGEEFLRLRRAEAVRKIWAREADLWKHSPEQARLISDRLGWLDGPQSMRAEASVLQDLARDIEASGVCDIVLLGMGGASRSAKVFARLFPAPGGRRFFVVDSSDPAAIQEVDRSIDLRHCLFIVASKSGKTIETLSQFFYFHDRVKKAGIVPPGGSFVAITDHGSDLEALAEDQSFRMTFRNPPDIGGGYSALSYFGLVPAALWGVDIAAVLDSALEMRRVCSGDGDAGANPGLQLGSLLGAAARRGDDKLFLLSSRRLAPLTDWVAPLIAESTGKEERGIVPAAGGMAFPLDVLARGGVAVAVSLESDDDTAVQSTLRALERRGAAFVEIRLNCAAQVGAEFFKWEMATAFVAASLAINPFDEPNMQQSKDNTSLILEAFKASREMPFGSARLSESGVELYAEGDVRGSISSLELAGALRALFSERRPDDYVAILAYVARDAANGAALEALRAMLAECLCLPVLLDYGPGYLHSGGQLYKGGPSSGIFLMITSEKISDVAIPGAPYSFGQLEMAQALGDLQSLANVGKPVVRLHFREGVAPGLTTLRRAAEDALSAWH